ncbi:MAG: hypothetical protein K2M17_03720 [Bacilli bacterium]|nr:hypothetical protein [Bacilli bacterium]
MMGIICLTLLIFIIISLSRRATPTTGNKRIVEITTEKGRKRYRCEEEFEDGNWEILQIGHISKEGIVSHDAAIFDSKDEALRFIGQLTEQIVTSKKIVE